VGGKRGTGVAEQVSKIDIGFVPEAAVSGAVLIQSEYTTFLVFNAMTLNPETEIYEDVGLAVCRFPDCIVTKFGYPNDEARSAIPRTRGFGYDVCEVFESAWKQEIDQQNRYAFPNHAGYSKRHFLILFHDSSFECLATSIETELTREPFSVVMARISARIEGE
jgi:hypothetical protein